MSEHSVQRSVIELFILIDHFCYVPNFGGMIHSVLFEILFSQFPTSSVSHVTESEEILIRSISYLSSGFWVEGQLHLF